MNNFFTKNELKSILGAFQYVDDDPAWRNRGGWDDELREKIVAMVDKYHCNHEEWVWYSDDEPLRCRNCNMDKDE